MQDSLFAVQLQHLRLVLDLIVIYFLALAVSQVREANAGRRLHVNAPPESGPSSASPQVEHAAAARLRLRGLEPSPAEEQVSEQTSGPQLERRGVRQETAGNIRKGRQEGATPGW